MSPKIVAHTIVKNESRWIWYCLNSVLDFVDEIIVGNHGSTDNTIEIINSIHSPKIKIFNFSNISDENYSDVRTGMMAKTQTDWLLILDGDEIWPSAAIKNTIEIIRKNPDLDFIVQPLYNLVGDIYHYQSESAGKYNICGFKGHITIRAINVKKMGGIKFYGPHMQQGVYDMQNNLIQDRNNAMWLYQPIKYFHTTHLIRSEKDYSVQKRKSKYKFELGNRFPYSFEYPEVFYLPHPLMVPDPWNKISFPYFLNALIQTPLRYLKRKFH